MLPAANAAQEENRSKGANRAEMHLRLQLTARVPLASYCDKILIQE